MAAAGSAGGGGAGAGDRNGSGHGRAVVGEGGMSKAQGSAGGKN